jgi:hypothetical protein
MRYVHAFSAPLVALSLAGCPSPAPLRVAIYPVEGRLFVSGLPAANAHLTFHPIDGSRVRPVGRTGSDGTFTLTTFAPGDGAPAGEYVVTVVWPNDSIPLDECADPAAHDRMNGAYSDPTSRTVVVTVLPESNRIDVRVAVSSVGWSLPKKR